VKNVVVKSSKVETSENSIDSIKTATRFFPWIRRLFQGINIQNISVNDNNISVAYANEIFYVNSNFVEVVAEIDNSGDDYDFNIVNLNLKDFSLRANGEAKVNFEKGDYKFGGNFSSYGLNGKLDFNATNEMLFYNFHEVKSGDISSFITALARELKMGDEAKDWLANRIKFSDFQIENLSGKFDLNSFEYFPNEITAKGSAKDLNVTFHDDLEAVVAKDANLSFTNGNLALSFDAPSYENHDLNGSTVILKNLLESTEIEVNVHTNALLDDSVVNLLKAYKINLPLKQKSGATDANLTLAIKIEPYDLKTFGKFRLENSAIKIASADFTTREANVELNGTQVILKNTNLAMKNLFDAQISGNIDTTAGKGKFDVGFSKLIIGGGEIYSSNSLRTSATLDFSSKDVLLNFAKPKVNFVFANATNTIKIPDITPLKANSKIMKSLDVQSGALALNSKDFSTINVDIKGAKLNLDMLKTKDGRIYNSDDVSLVVKNGAVSGKTKSGRVAFDVSKSGDVSLNVNNLDFVLNTSGDGDSNLPKLAIKGSKIGLILVDLNKSINFETVSGTTNKDTLNFNATMKRGNLAIKKSKNSLSLTAKGIPGESVNELLGQESFAEGSFDLDVNGANAKNFTGKISVANAYLKDFVFYQGVLSFINSVPSLLTFKTPDFNEKGFTIKEGKVNFTRNGDLIDIKGMNFIGSSADIAGLGKINLGGTKALDVQLEIKYLKDASKILGSIPIINQIFLGRDRKLSTIIKIGGTMTKPTYESHVAGDLLQTPFTLIKNILELPVSLFDSHDEPTDKDLLDSVPAQTPQESANDDDELLMEPEYED